MQKNILTSILPLGISLILFIVVGKYGINRVQGLRVEISESSKDKTILNQKLDTLRTVSSAVATGSKIAVSALPEKNASIMALSQLKIIAAQNGLQLSKLKSSVSPQETNGLIKSEISFELGGTRAGVMAFLKSVQKFAPISMVNKLKLNESVAGTTANISVITFSAPFPKNIPTITEPIKDLTQDERNILTNVGALSQPQFVEVPPSNTSGKTDPFTQ